MRRNRVHLRRGADKMHHDTARDAIGGCGGGLQLALGQRNGRRHDAKTLRQARIQARPAEQIVQHRLRNAQRRFGERPPLTQQQHAHPPQRSMLRQRAPMRAGERGETEREAGRRREVRLELGGGTHQHEIPLETGEAEGLAQSFQRRASVRQFALGIGRHLFAGHGRRDPRPYPGDGVEQPAQRLRGGIDRDVHAKLTCGTSWPLVGPAAWSTTTKLAAVSTRARTT